MSNSKRDQVIEVICEQLSVKPEEVKDNASFIDDLGADSLDTVELVMGLEEKLDLDIPDEEAEKLTDLSKVMVYLDSLDAA